MTCRIIKIFIRLQSDADRVGNVTAGCDLSISCDNEKSKLNLSLFADKKIRKIQKIQKTRSLVR